MPDHLETYGKWINYAGLDAKTKAELSELRPNEIEDYFKEPLEFGTGGIRGIMRPGINSMNIYVIRQATQAMANLVKEKKLAEKGVVIAFDSRNGSELFAKETAKTFAANGIKAYIFDGIRPTPELSFAIRYKKCAAGINITASHNPKEYSGYKAYWEDGGQLSLEDAKLVEAEIRKTDIFGSVKTCGYDEAVKEGLIEKIGGEIDGAYLEAVRAQSVRDSIKNAGDGFAVVYTPLHGAGHRLVPEALKDLKNLFTVGEQTIIDGSFPTVRFPNPEHKEVFEAAIEIAKKNSAELIIGTDADADRMGIAVRADSGEYTTLTGNQVGVLLLDYIIAAKKESKTLKASDCAIKTIVTTELARKICEANNVKIIDVLTGFKFIGGKIKEFEETGENTFLFGFEESYGYLAGTHARDKDAVVASMLVTEMAAYYRAKNMNLLDALQELYEKHGYHNEYTENIKVTGIDWKDQMQKTMADLRKALPKEIGAYKVTGTVDYDDEKTNTGLPKENVLRFDLENGSKVMIRPSGTEPKIKIYYLILAGCEKCAKKQSENLMSAMGAILDKQ